MEGFKGIHHVFLDIENWFEVMPTVYTLNSTVDRAEPCGRPGVIVQASEAQVPSLIATVLFSIASRIHIIIAGVTPLFYKGPHPDVKNVVRVLEVKSNHHCFFTSLKTITYIWGYNCFNNPGILTSAVAA